MRKIVFGLLLLAPMANGMEKKVDVNNNNNNNTDRARRLLDRLPKKKDPAKITWERVLTPTGLAFLMDPDLFSPDMQRELSKLVLPDMQIYLKLLCDVEVGFKELAGHTNWVRSVAISPDGKYIVTGSHDDTARVWDVKAGNCIHELTGHKDSIYSVAISPDGKSIVTGSYDNTARVWDRETGNCIHVLTGHKGPVTSVAISPDGKYIVTGSHDDTARVWDVKAGNCIHELTGHKGPVTSVAISSDGKYIVTGSGDHTARVWDIEGLLAIKKILDTQTDLSQLYLLKLIDAAVDKKSRVTLSSEALVVYNTFDPEIKKALARYVIDEADFFEVTEGYCWIV